jgi:hypothetical protein
MATQPPAETFKNIAGFSMDSLQFQISLLSGGFIVLCTCILLGTALWQLHNKEEITLFTFVVVLFLSLGFMSIFLAFITS